MPERRKWDPKDIFCATASGRRRRNEDRVLALMSGERAAVAVLDGHGGETVVDFAARRLQQLLQEETMHTAEAYLGRIHAAVCDELSDAAQMTGTTVTLALVSHTEIAVAWLGDSDAVLCRRGYKGSYGPEDQIVSKLLTDTHDPGRADEQERIKALGGSIRELPASGRKFRPAGELRVWLDGRRSLPLTRSLGDLAMRPLISGEPQMVQLSRRTGDDLFVIVASDGVWDVLSPAYACRVAISACSEHPNVNDAWETAAEAIPGDTWNSKIAAQAVLQEALYWGSADNISVAIIMLV